MTEIHLNVDDPRVGKRNPDGSAARKPKVDLQHQSYAPGTRPVWHDEASEYFVVLPILGLPADTTLVIDRPVEPKTNKAPAVGLKKEDAPTP